MANRGAPDVSVIIPTFNRLWSLPQTVESCRSLSLSVEIIVVDDGSTDGTWDWLQSQPDLVALRQENQGKDWAVNRAFAQARGPYVRFLDSDDWLAAGANETQLAIARAQDADVVAGPFMEVFEPGGGERLHPMPVCDDFIAQQLGECGSSHYSAYLFRRTFLNAVSHRQEFGALDDRMFVIEASIAGPKVALSPDVALFHRQHDGPRLQFQRGVGEVITAMNHLRVMKRAAAMLETREALTDRRARAIAKSTWPIAARLAQHDLKVGSEILEWIKSLDPEFEPADTSLRKTAYRLFGIEATWRLARLRRALAPRQALQTR